MSRIGRLPIAVPSGVDVTIEGRRVTVKAPKGSLSRELHPDMKISREDEQLGTWERSGSEVRLDYDNGNTFFANRTSNSRLVVQDDSGNEWVYQRF